MVLEKKLFKLDNADSETHAYRNQSIRRDKADEQSEREILIDKIDRKLKEYGELYPGQRECETQHCSHLQTSY